MPLQIHRTLPHRPGNGVYVRVPNFGKVAIENDKIWSRLLADNSNRPTLPLYEDSQGYWDVLLDFIADELSNHNTMGLTRPAFNLMRKKLAWEVKKAYEIEFISVYFAKSKKREDFRK